MSAYSGFAKLLVGYAVFGLLAFAQHGGGGGAHGGGGFGGGHASVSGFHASGGGFHANSGSRGPIVSPGYPSGGAFPAGVHNSPYSPFRSSPTVGVGTYPGISHFGAYGTGRSGNYGPWRSNSRRGRLAYGVPFAYFAPYGYLGTPFYGDYDNDFYNGTPSDDNGYSGYDSGAYNQGVQPPYPEQPPYDPSAMDPYAQYPVPLRNPDIQPAPSVSEPLPSSPPISLVLNSGETLKIQNYAIVGRTFWDLSSHPMRKIPVSSINIEASSKATEAAGAEFPDLTGTS